jgi:hypothetical protein
LANNFLPGFVLFDSSANLEDVIESSINENGTIDKDAMEGFVNNLMVEFPNLGLAGVEDEFSRLWGLLGEDKITFQGNEYKITKNASDVEKLKRDLNSYIKTRKGQATQTTSTTVKSR